MNISEKASYIKGLIEGMKLNTADGEGKVIAAMADLLEDISLSVLDLEDETATLNDYVEELDEDLGAVEEDFYECDDDDECDEDECDCGECGDDCDCIELECPACGEPVYIDECDIDKIKELECPSCGKTLTLVSDESDGCDCGCDCGCDDEQK